MARKGTTERFLPGHGSRATKGDTFRRSRNAGAKRHQGTPRIRVGKSGQRVNPQAY